MSDDLFNSETKITQKENNENKLDVEEAGQEIIEKEFVPHYLPTYRIRFKLYPLPIILVVIFAGALSYITYIQAGVRIDGGYISEEEFGAIGGLLNGIIFTLIAVGSAFIIIFLIKKIGLNVLKYLFSFTIGFISFFLSWFFGEILIYLIFIQLPPSNILIRLYYTITQFELPFFAGVLSIYLMYKYITFRSIKSKNLIILYISLLTGASLGVIMPLWTTLSILIGISLWDIFAVFYRKGPIKQMFDIASQNDRDLVSDEIKERIKTGEAIYDTSKIEIGIGDLIFYSLLTSTALIQSTSLFVMILTSAAIIFGTGLTLMGLKKNRILPGLPISIFLGIATMLISWYIISILI
ncbi:MAG: hypothetical protein ACFFD5_02155 [Candidatus Thorarchaeota archaeon]